MTALRAFARGEMGKSRKGSWRREAQRSENGNQTKAELVQAWGGQIFCVSHGSIGGGGRAEREADSVPEPGGAECSVHQGRDGGERADCS